MSARSSILAKIYFLLPKINEVNFSIIRLIPSLETSNLEGEANSFPGRFDSQVHVSLRGKTTVSY
jgi:hypothetical protein